VWTDDEANGLLAAMFLLVVFTSMAAMLLLRLR